MYTAKQLDFTTPFGEVICGKEVTFNLITPSLEEVAKAYKDGFYHLVDGSFIWASKSCGKVIHLYSEGFQYIKDSDGNLVKFEHTHSGSFKTIVIAEEN